MSKRKEAPSAEVNLDLKNAAEEVECVTVDRVVGNISPMKTGKKSRYFEAKMTDGEVQMRVVGFQGTQRRKLMSFSESEKSVTLKNCRITRSKLSEHFEIQLKSGSSVEQSDKTFDVDMSKLLTQKITVSEVVNRSVYEKISCSAKVIKIDEPLKVSGGITKQDTVIADDTGAIKLTFWENDIGTIEEGKSYDFIVRTYNNSKYLSLPKEDAGVKEIDDIGDVAPDDLPDDDITVFHGAEVAGVFSLDHYYACLKCKSKVTVLSGEAALGCCSNSSMKQRLDRCKRQLSARMMVMCGEDFIALHAFGTNVSDIADGDAHDITEESLIAAKPFTVSYQGGIITGVKRSQQQ